MNRADQHPDDGAIVIEAPPSSSETESTARYANRKDAILETAMAVLDEHGAGGFSLAAVAKRMDLHPVSLTYYFKKRDNLLTACWLSSVARYEALIAEAERVPTPQARVRALIAAHFDVQRRTRLGEVSPIGTFAEIRSASELDRVVVLGAYRRMFARLAELFRSDHGGPSPLQSSLYSRLMLDLLGWSRNWLSLYGPEDYAGVAARVADVLIDGIAAHGRGWPSVTPAPLGEPLVESGEATRERFLVAAIEVLNSHGYQGASVDKISARLNVTKGSFYYHNADKDDLVSACVDHSLETLRQGQAGPYPGDGLERLAAAALSLALHQATGRRGRMLRHYTLVSLTPSHRQSVQARYQQTALRFAAMIGDGVADGSIRPVDPMIGGLVLMVVINSAAYLGAAVPGATSDQVEPDYVRPVFTGLFAAE
jgi:AcrR family transcriptional regulator